MVQRVAFVLMATFWVLMNVLLWRSEYGRKNSVGSEVPLETVWRRMLTAPDTSSLEIRHHGIKIGFCRWGASVSERVAASGQPADDNGPEGMVRNVTGYRIDFGGNVIIMSEKTGRLRFDLSAGFSTNQEWREFSLRTTLRPSAWEIHATAADQRTPTSALDTMSPIPFVAANLDKHTASRSLQTSMAPVVHAAALS